jgi:hypothetical protein
MDEDRYSRGAVWEHHGERLTVLCSSIVLGMSYVHFDCDALRGALRDEMTEANGWRFVENGGVRWRSW